MLSRVVVPGTVRLELSGGDWILVKSRLNAGETREMMARLMTVNVNVNDPEAIRRTGLAIDPMEAGLSSVLAYLIDWSLVDPEGDRIVIFDTDLRERMPTEYLRAALNSIDFDSYMEIQEAIQAHERTVNLARAEEKKRRGAALTSNKTSPSLGDAVGAMSGSPSSR